MSGSTRAKRPLLRPVLLLFSLFAPVLSLHAQVVVESTAEFQLNLRAQDSNALPGISFTLPLPGYGGSVLLVPAEAVKELSIPLLTETHQREAKLSLYAVTDERAIYGLVSLSSEGMFGTFIDRSSPKTALWELAPAGNGMHRVSRLELPERAGSVSESRSVDRLKVKDIAVWRKVELVVSAPSEFAAGRNDDAITAQIVSTVAAAGVFYEPLGLVLELKGVEIFSSPQADPYANASDAQSALLMLDTARVRWPGRPVPEHDVVVVLGRGRFNGEPGLSYPGTSCIAPDYSVVFASQGGDSDLAQTSLGATLAHELGHFFGMSHDNTYYDNGPSLMWPYYFAAPFGFSERSMNEFYLYAGLDAAGGSCLAATQAPAGVQGPNTPAPPAPDSLTFAEGPVINLFVQEGGVLIHQFAVLGASAPLTFAASNLPPGADFDPRTGVLAYRPGFSTVTERRGKRVLRISLQASSLSGQAFAALQITVADVNQPPQFAAPASDIISAAPGQLLQFQILAVDTDVRDRVKLHVLNARALKKTPGSPRVSIRSGQAVFKWRVPAGFNGTIQLWLLATDRYKGSTPKLVTISIQ